MSIVRINRISPPGYIHDQAFVPVTSVLFHTLQAMGRKAEVGFNAIAEDQTNIVLCSHLMQDPKSLIGKNNVIVYNFEQFDTHSHWFSSDYMALLKSKPYWDYSKRNIEAVKKVCPDIEAHHVPFAYDQILDYSYVRRDVFRTKSKDIDVLFYGSMNDRRAKVIDQIKNMGLNVQAVFGIYGPELSILIHRSKVVLNMHYYDSSVFEAVRVLPLLASRVAVVSEKSVDDEEYKYLDPVRGLRVTDYDNLAVCCKELVDCDETREALCVTGSANVKLKAMAQSLETVKGML